MTSDLADIPLSADYGKADIPLSADYGKSTLSIEWYSFFFQVHEEVLEACEFGYNML